MLNTQLFICSNCFPLHSNLNKIGQNSQHMQIKVIMKINTTAFCWNNNQQTKINISTSTINLSIFLKYIFVWNGSRNVRWNDSPKLAFFVSILKRETIRSKSVREKWPSEYQNNCKWLELGQNQWPQWYQVPLQTVTSSPERQLLTSPYTSNE